MIIGSIKYKKAIINDTITKTTIYNSGMIIFQLRSALAYFLNPLTYLHQ